MTALLYGSNPCDQHRLYSLWYRDYMKAGSSIGLTMVVVGPGCSTFFLGRGLPQRLTILGSAIVGANLVLATGHVHCQTG